MLGFLSCVAEVLGAVQESRGRLRRTQHGGIWWGTGCECGGGDLKGSRRSPQREGGKEPSAEVG